MSIRSIALELYRAKQKTDALQKMHDEASLDQRASLIEELNLAKKELHMLRRMLDGEKESGATRQKFTGFGASKK
jgi:hypothetical protein